MSSNLQKEFAVLPKHVAIIMDGNGRWAKEQGQERMFGHQYGVQTVRKMVEIAVELGLEYLSLFTFSMENWNRPKQEIDALMKLLVDSIEKEIDELDKNNVRLMTIGDMSLMPKYCYDSIEKSIQRTSKNNGLHLCIALSYSGKWDIVQAAKKMCADCVNKAIDINDIDEAKFANYLATASIPDPELLIRTSGETRISNFYLWQLAYTEIYYTKKYWPEFGKEDLLDALRDFQKRERRFGRTTEQIKK